MAAQNFSREHFIGQARVAFVLDAISALYYPHVATASWEGDEREGAYECDDHCGNWWTLGWSASGLVALMFHHESGRNEIELPEEARSPLRWLPDLPASLQALAEQLAARRERLVTAGLWIQGRRHALPDPWNKPWVHGLERLRRYALDAEKAVFAAKPGQSWLEMSSLSEAQGCLAIRLARDLACGPVVVTAEDEAVLLATPEGAKPATPEAAEEAARMLMTIGVRWEAPAPRLREEQRAREAARIAGVREALGPLACDLFEAVRVNDAARVRALLGEGAPIDARTVADQWSYTPAEDTPLIQAVKAGAAEVAYVLIEAGADLSLQNSVGQTALACAACVADEAVVQALLARGADPNLARRDGTSPLHEAATRGHEGVIRALVSAGADRSARAWHGRTPAEVAVVAGHPELVPLLG